MCRPKANTIRNSSASVSSKVTRFGVARQAIRRSMLPVLQQLQALQPALLCTARTCHPSPLSSTELQMPYVVDNQQAARHGISSDSSAVRQTSLSHEHLSSNVQPTGALFHHGAAAKGQLGNMSALGDTAAQRQLLPDIQAHLRRHAVNTCSVRLAIQDAAASSCHSACSRY